MSAIKSKNTAPELVVRKALFKRGFRYRIHSSSVPGHPDIWMKKYNAALYINGCFWHRHKDCKYAYVPKTRTDFWVNKFNNNIVRDAKVRTLLEEKGIRCLVIWECTIRKAQKNADSFDELVCQIESFLKSEKGYMEL